MSQLRKLICDFRYIKNAKYVKSCKLSDDTKKFLLTYFHWCLSIDQAIYSYKSKILKKPCCGLSGCSNTQHFSNQTKYSDGCCHAHTTKINMLKKYGVDNISKLTTTKEKVAKTSIKKFGHANIFASTEFKDTLKVNNMEKYGVEYSVQRKDVIEKTKNKNLKNYGVSCTLQNQDIKNKVLISLKERYGSEHFSKNPTVKNKRLTSRRKKFIDTFSSLISKDFICEFNLKDYTTKYEKYKFTCNKCNHPFNFEFDTNNIFPRCPVCNPTKNNNLMESDLFNLLPVENKIQNNRSILSGKELDIYLPNHDIAIEFNGLYWHSELNGKDRNYHLNKTKLCNDKKIQLIHVFETEWTSKRSIVLSSIFSKLGIFKHRIQARKCVIKKIDKTEKNNFLRENHLQGNDRSSIFIGLFYDDELVSVMTFGKSRYNKKYEYEMHRFCTKMDYQVMGGASKLWNYFVKTYNPKSVITYADRRYSVGTVYNMLGFTHDGHTKPNYFYFKKGNKLLSRLNFQKHNLASKLHHFDSCLTEWENMQLNGYDRIWDCGNYRYIWNSKT
jgi:hypothetical protein